MAAANYRLIVEDDFDRWMHCVGTAFAVEPEGRERMPAFYKRFQLDWTVGADIDGEVGATVTTIPLDMFMEGRVVPFGAVTAVTCLPEYRRQGHVGKLLRMTLELMRERGQHVGALYTPHAPLYRRYGWEICSDQVNHEFGAKKFKIRPGSAEGRLIPAGYERWQDFDPVYRAYAEGRNGEIVRNKQFWFMAFQGGFEFKPGISYLWESPRGTLDGFLLVREQGGTGPGEGNQLNVRHLVALIPDAMRGLLQAVLSFDLAEKIRWHCGPEDPVLDLIDEPIHVDREVDWKHFLRIVNVPGAFAQRPAYSLGTVVVEVADPVCPWNEGTWEMTAAEGSFAVESTATKPHLKLDANALAQVFAGFRKPSELARVGRAELLADDPVRIDEFFRMRYQPYTHDFY
jgi:predicted acetyltransferase